MLNNERLNSDRRESFPDSYYRKPLPIQMSKKMRKTSENNEAEESLSYNFRKHSDNRHFKSKEVAGNGKGAYYSTNNRNTRANTGYSSATGSLENSKLADYKENETPTPPTGKLNYSNFSNAVFIPKNASPGLPIFKKNSSFSIGDLKNILEEDVPTHTNTISNSASEEETNNSPRYQANKLYIEQHQFENKQSIYFNNAPKIVSKNINVDETYYKKFSYDGPIKTANVNNNNPNVNLQKYKNNFVSGSEKDTCNSNLNLGVTNNSNNLNNQNFNTNIFLRSNSNGENINFGIIDKTGKNGNFNNVNNPNQNIYQNIHNNFNNKVSNFPGQVFGPNPMPTHNAKNFPVRNYNFYNNQNFISQNQPQCHPQLNQPLFNYTISNYIKNDGRPPLPYTSNTTTCSSLLDNDFIYTGQSENGQSQRNANTNNTNVLNNINPYKRFEKKYSSSINNSYNLSLNSTNANSNNNINNNFNLVTKRKSFAFHENDNFKQNFLIGNTLMNKKVNFNFVKNNYNKFNVASENNNENTEILTLKLNFIKEKVLVLNIHRFDDIYSQAKEFCEKNKLNDELIKPIVKKISEALAGIYKVVNLEIEKSDLEYLNSLSVLSENLGKNNKSANNFYNFCVQEQKASLNLDITSISEIALTDDDFGCHDICFSKLNKSF